MGLKQDLSLIINSLSLDNKIGKHCGLGLKDFFEGLGDIQKIWSRGGGLAVKCT